MYGQQVDHSRFCRCGAVSLFDSQANVLRIGFDDKPIADDDRIQLGFVLQGRDGFDSDFRADAVGVADAQEDSRCRQAHSGSASSVSMRELSHTTVRSANMAVSPSTR
ncbi:hypothetical protein D3C80_1453290 [compost metagenome]